MDVKISAVRCPIPFAAVGNEQEESHKSFYRCLNEMHYVRESEDINGLEQSLKMHTIAMI